MIGSHFVLIGWLIDLEVIWYPEFMYIALVFCCRLTWGFSFCFPEDLPYYAPSSPQGIVEWRVFVYSNLGIRSWITKTWKKSLKFQVKNRANNTHWRKILHFWFLIFDFCIIWKTYNKWVTFIDHKLHNIFYSKRWSKDILERSTPTCMMNFPYWTFFRDPLIQFFYYWCTLKFQALFWCNENFLGLSVSCAQPGSRWKLCGYYPLK